MVSDASIAERGVRSLIIIEIDQGWDKSDMLFVIGTPLYSFLN